MKEDCRGKLSKERFNYAEYEVRKNERKERRREEALFRTSLRRRKDNHKTINTNSLKFNRRTIQHVRKLCCG